MIELDDIKAWIGASLDEEYDDMLTALEVDAVSYVEAHTGRYLRAPASIVEVLSGRGQSTLYVANPILSLTSVEHRESGGSTWSAQAASDFIVDENAVHRAPGAFPSGHRNVRITYRAGYAAGQEPAIARQAVRELVEQWFRSRVTVTGGVIPGPEAESTAQPRTVDSALRRLRLVTGT